MTDREQKVLRAITHVGRGGLAEVTKVVKIVSYPKAETKRILVSLWDKGEVILHRHDYPQSLTPAERKLMVRRQDGQGRWNYYSAVSTMAKQNASAKKLSLPVEWQVRPLSWGGVRWQHRQEEGDDVYDRPFTNESDLEWYLAERYGWKFARKVLAALKTSKGDPVGTVKKNPRNVVYKAEVRDDAFRVYQKGHPHNNSGWIKLNSHSEPIRTTQEARREAAAFIKQVKAGVLPLKNPGGLPVQLLKMAIGTVAASNPYMDLVIKGQAKRVADGWQIGKKVFPWGRGAQQIRAHVFLDKSTGLVYSKKERNMKTRFRDLSIGERFKFTGGSFNNVSTKTSARGYTWTANDGRTLKSKVGSINVEVVRANKARRKNIAGFKDDAGVFHPIRSGMEMSPSGKLRKSSKKYKPKKVGEKATYAKKRKPAKKAAKKRATVKRAPSKKRAPARKAAKRTTSKRRNPTYKIYVKDRFGAGQIYYGEKEAATAAKAKDAAWREIKSEYLYSKGEPRHKKSHITVKAANPRARKIKRRALWSVWVESRGTTQGRNKYVVLISTPTNRDLGEHMSEAYDKKDAEWQARMLRQKIKAKSHDTKWIWSASNPDPKHGSATKAARLEIAKQTVGSTPLYVFKWMGKWHQSTSEPPRHSTGIVIVYPDGSVKPFKRSNPRKRKAKKNGKVKVVVSVSTRKKKAGRKNPSASSIRKTFAGRHTKDSKLYFPDGTPQGIAKLGKLICIKPARGNPIKLNNPAGEVWLCSDTRGRLHLGSTVDAPLYAPGAPRDFGEVKEIEYLESKPHLGYPKTLWFHKLGEEGGARPTLHVNQKGELKFKGGDYRLTERGIEN